MENGILIDLQCSLICKQHHLLEISIYCSCCFHKSDVQYNLRPLHSPRPPPRTCWHAPCCSSHIRLDSSCLEAAPRQHQCRRFWGCCLMDPQESQGRLFHIVHCPHNWNTKYNLFLSMLFVVVIKQRFGIWMNKMPVVSYWSIRLWTVMQNAIY